MRTFKSICRGGTAIIAGLLFTAGYTQARETTLSTKTHPVLADLKGLKAIGVKAKLSHEATQVGYAEISPSQEQALAYWAHRNGKCGGYEKLPYNAASYSSLGKSVFGYLSERVKKDQNNSYKYTKSSIRPQFQTRIESAIHEVSESKIKQTIDLLSSFPTRYNKGLTANEPVLALKGHIEEILKDSNLKAQVELISHNSTPQQSIRVRIPGQVRPNEIIVLGGHMDSINQEWFGPKKAPGADDNASGSANLVEALRILSRQPQPERTIDFYWYAGEESGLLGSAEIAREARNSNQDIIAVLQLDMTLFPGSGEFVMGSMTDFTSAWMRTYLESINQLYLKAKIIEDKCGYGCSDHASWYRQGYPTLMPFEATFDGMNHNLHTSKDVINSESSLAHSAMFSKIALIIAMDLGSSTNREP